MTTTSTSTRRKSSDALLDSETVLLEKGWIQGAMQDENGSVCLAGALVTSVCGVLTKEHQPMTEEEKDLYLRTELFVRSAVTSRLGYFGSSALTIPDWNDSDDRVVADVLDVIHDAALLAKEAGD